MLLDNKGEELVKHAWPFMHVNSPSYAPVVTQDGGGDGDGGGGGGGGVKSYLALVEKEGDAILYPLPLGARRTSKPQAEMAPEPSSAAKARSVEAMLTKPLPLGAPLPPFSQLPHAEIAPESSSAAKA